MRPSVSDVPRPLTAPERRARRSGARRGFILIAASLVVAATAAVLGLGVGSHAIAPATVIDAVVHHDPTNDDHVIVVVSRFPRILLGLIVGAALGVAGCLMQSVTRNPLADPGILGVNAGAGLFVAVAISAFGVTTVSGYVWFAFLGAAVVAVLVFLLGTAQRGGGTPARIALAGTAVTITVSAITQMILISDETAFASFRYWSVGSLQGRGMDVILTLAPFMLVGALLALSQTRPLDALALGEDTARSLGTRVGLARITSGLAVVLLCGAATAAAGPIGFVGLAAAHVVRRVVGNAHALLLPGSLVLGAAFLVSADAAGRWIVAPGELQTGIAAALLGGPVFIAVVRARRVTAL